MSYGQFFGINQRVFLPEIFIQIHTKYILTPKSFILLTFLKNYLREDEISKYKRNPTRKSMICKLTCKLMALLGTGLERISNVDVLIKCR